MQEQLLASRVDLASEASLDKALLPLRGPPLRKLLVPSPPLRLSNHRQVSRSIVNGNVNSKRSRRGALSKPQT